jgi:hypothetical protein
MLITPERNLLSGDLTEALGCLRAWWNNDLITRSRVRVISILPVYPTSNFLIRQVYDQARSGRPCPTRPEIEAGPAGLLGPLGQVLHHDGRYSIFIMMNKEVPTEADRPYNLDSALNTLAQPA